MVKGSQERGKEVRQGDIIAFELQNVFGYIVMISQWKFLTSLAAVWEIGNGKARVEGGCPSGTLFHLSR